MRIFFNSLFSLVPTSQRGNPVLVAVTSDLGSADGRKHSHSGAWERESPWTGAKK